MTFKTEGVLVDLEAGPSKMRVHVATPSRDGRRPAVMVAHELFGVNADIRGAVDRVAELGYFAIAPEFYHRDAEPGERLERDESGRKRGFELLHRLTREGVVADVASTMRYSVARPDCDGRVGMLGFSMGGHIAYLAATRLGLVATAVLYGGWLTGTEIPLSQPERTLDLTSGIARHHGRLLYIVGGKDKLIDAAQVTAIDRALVQAGVFHEVVVYPEAEHAFFWEGTPPFHRASRDDAWHRIGAFFEAAFASGGPDSRAGTRP
jgi:carboxymethylenebutenolidase